MKLIKKYGAKLVNGTIKDKELETLAKQKNFIVNGCNKQEAMIDFVINIAPFLTKQRLHHITSKLIKINSNSCFTPDTFWRSTPYLSLYFTAYEAITLAPDKTIKTLSNEFKDHIKKHKIHTRYSTSRTHPTCYDSFVQYILTDLFINAVKLTAARSRKDYEFKVTPPFNKKKQMSKYDAIIDIQITGSQLEQLLKNQIKLNYPEKTPNQELPLLTKTEEFKKLKQSILTIINRATRKDLLKALGIKKVIDAIEENKSNEEILQIIADNEKDIIKNTGTGFYSLFNCGCCEGYQSKSHKLLDKIKNTLENPESLSEKTKLLNYSINNI
ncbi:MAG: hypothetical protein PVG30_01225 [Gammaproteobacteria bacterium]